MSTNMFDLERIIEQTVHTDWKDILLENNGEDKSELESIGINLTVEYIVKFQEKIPFYPPKSLIFNAFTHFNVMEMKVCIIAMDPFINPGQAIGLSFGVPENIKIPPSLRNIYKEIESDIGVDMSERSGDLTRWAEQGILLLNASLTVRHRKSGSHMKYWKKYTDQLIGTISEITESVVFILWGKFAKKKEKFIDTTKHHIVKAVHPSPLSAYRGFFGCKCFSKCNTFLQSIGKEPIDW